MAFEELSNRLLEKFERLNPREKLFVGVGSIAAIIIIISMGWLLISRSIDTLNLRVKVKKEKLEQLVELQSTFAKREAKTKELQRLLKRNKIRLVSHVESAATKAGVEIGNMTPREGSPDPDGIKETTLEIRLQKLSITRLRKFLERLESTKQGIVRIKRLRVRKRYDDKSLLDVELSIATYTI